LNDVDWSRTLAYSMGNFGQMYVNLRGREPHGRVAPGAEHEAVLKDLEDGLRSMRDPDTGQPVIDQIWRGTEVFQGKHAGQAPDLFFFTRDMSYKAMGLSDFASNSVFDDLYGTYGHHRMNGLLMLSGPGVRSGEHIEGARLIDLAPTIYALMGVAAPPGLDGQVLDRLFDDGLRPASRLQDAPLSSPVEASEVRVYSSEEEAELSEQLRGLGYVS
jgi:predicted AlkP superfamily phosphohydrolase/phosphomutase